MKKEIYTVYATGMHSAKYGGLERFIVLLARELKQFNVRVIVLYNSEPASEAFKNDLKEAGGMVIVAHALDPLKYFFSLLKIFIKYRPRLVHASFQIYYTVLFSKLLFCRNIFTSLNGMITDRQIRDIFEPEKIAPMTRIFRKIINRFTRKFYAISDAVRDQYIQLYPSVKNKIVTEYIGSLPSTHSREVSRDLLGIAPEKVIIGSICFNSPIKGLDILLDAVEILVKEYKCREFMLYHIGIDPLAPENRALIESSEKRGITDFVIWKGIINNVEEYLPGMDIYCQPSRSEGLGFSIVEAGMAGLPVVGTDNGGIPEIIKNDYNGYLFRKENAGELAEILYRLIGDADLRKELGQNSKTFFNRDLNMEEHARTVCSHYLETLKLKVETPKN